MPLLEPFGMPWRVYASLFWKPAPLVPGRDTVVVVEMGSDESFPLLWKSVGSFIAGIARVNIAVVPYRRADAVEIARHAPRAVVLTGFHQELSTYDFGEMEALFGFLRSAATPVLGICGGYEFLSMAFGAKIVELGFEERGFVDVDIIGDDPIFGAHDGRLIVYNRHALKVDRVPEGFELLGASKACPQIIRHGSLPVYGVQFHPEFSSRRYDDGTRLFRRFLFLAGVTAFT
jgi:GMP synthase-like glutamine amidotransferase